MVVEDDRLTAETLALILRGDGHDVKIAADGCTALVEVKAREPDLIFVDINLPDMDGYAVAKRIREQSAPRRDRVWSKNSAVNWTGLKLSAAPADKDRFKPIAMAGSRNGAICL